MICKKAMARAKTSMRKLSTPTRERLEAARPRNGFFPPQRGLEAGYHPFLALLPGALESPALRLVGTDRFPGRMVLQTANVCLVSTQGYCWVDETVPCIILTQSYYETGSDFDLYLDLLHEATHIRQVLEGRDVWDQTCPYHKRPTEIEGYAVAVSECRRLGVSEKDIIAHLSNPWLTDAQVAELLAGIDVFLAGHGP